MLRKRVRLGLQIPFTLNKNKECTFLIKKQDILNFELSDCAGIKIGLLYFTLWFAKEMQSLLHNTEHRKTQKCILLVTKSKLSNTFYYAVISNNWHALDDSKNFEIINDLKHN